VQIAQAVLD